MKESHQYRRQVSSVKEIQQFLARGLGVKVKGRVEKQDCNEQ